MLLWRVVHFEKNSTYGAGPGPNFGPVKKKELFPTEKIAKKIG